MAPIDLLVIALIALAIAFFVGGAPYLALMAYVLAASFFVVTLIVIVLTLSVVLSCAIKGEE